MFPGGGGGGGGGGRRKTCEPRETDFIRNGTSGTSMADGGERMESSCDDVRWVQSFLIESGDVFFRKFELGSETRGLME